MSRNVNGTYSLPAGNPVVPNTTIDSTWANPTMDDIAASLTDSLSRTGLGGMLAPFLNADGTQANAGISWTNEPTSGWYRASTGTFTYSVAGANIFTITSAGIALSPTKGFSNFNTNGPATFNGTVQFNEDIVIQSGNILNTDEINSPSSSLGFDLGSVNKMTLTNGGLGLGVTPQTWFAAYKAIQLGTSGASISGRNDAIEVSVSNNYYRDAAGVYRYVATDAAAQYKQISNSHVFEVATTGNAGNPITWLSAATLTGTGLTVNGVGVFNGTNTCPLVSNRAGSGSEVFIGQFAGVQYLSLSGNSSASGFNTAAGLYHSHFIGATEILRVASTGLAVTGTLSATGNTKIGSGAAPNTEILMVNRPAGSLTGLQLYQDGVESWTMGMAANATALSWKASAVEKMTLSNSGLAVTGTLSATGVATIGTTAKWYSSELAGFSWWTTGAAGAGAGLASAGTDLILRANGSNIAIASATGLAVTGTLSAGTGTTTTAGLKLINGSTGVGSGYGGIYAENITPSGTNFAFAAKYDGSITGLNAVTGGLVNSYINGSVITAVSSTGLAVTGTTSTTGNLGCGGASVATRPSFYANNTGLGFEFQNQNTGGTAGGVEINTAAPQGSSFNLLDGYTNITGTPAIQFFIRGDGTYGSRPNVYGATSDIKLKKDIILAGSQWDDVKALSKVVKKFRFKDDPDGLLMLGFIAQDVELISPALVDETPDKEAFTNEAGDKDYRLTGETTKSVKYSIAYMKALKALGEALERIESLEAKFDAYVASHP